MSPRHIDALLVDMQGRLRTKRLPASQREKLLAGETRLPLSTLTQDILGEDNETLTGIGLVDGDPDGLCIAEERTLAIQPWNPEAEQVIVSLHGTDGRASPFDPRALLAAQVAALAARGLHAVVAVELEFYLFDGSTRDSGVPMIPARLAIAGAPLPLQLYDPRVMDRIEPVLARIHAYADALEVPTESTLCEYGPGQFEINLRHRSDALRAADEAQLFRRIVERAASDEGLVASFMAKPYTEHGGSGQHVHLSLVDGDGRNVFDAATTRPAEDLATPDGGPVSASLAAAVAGLLDTLDDATLVLAPHANSYRRLQPGSFAPHRIDWGFDHRGAAIRLPEVTGSNARLEHRAAGSDANTYLVLAALLGGVRLGLEREATLGQAPLVAGEPSDARAISHDWLGATARFRDSAAMAGIFGARFVDIYTRVKGHEAGIFNRTVGSVDWQMYLPRL